jgi:hypothetical protein
MITLRRFNDHDWQSYAGAERFHDGSHPLIGSVKLSDGLDVTVVVDFGALAFYVDMYQKEDANNWEEWWGYVDYHHAGEIINLIYRLQDAMDVNEFTEICEKFPIVFRKL